jgi:hypothetical protein
MTRREAFKKRIAELMERKPEAQLVENRYRVMRFILEPYFPTLFETLSKDALDQLFLDVVYLDRHIRHATEGIQDDKKTVLSQEYQLKELGAEVGYMKDVRRMLNA